MECGQVVISKAGRDSGEWFIVYGVDKDYLLLVNGKSRPLEHPKRKKIKHVQPTNNIDMTIQKLILEKGYIKNADFSNTLKRFVDKREVSHG
jgi:ribosomal protein L14E/L6E/L27E